MAATGGVAGWQLPGGVGLGLGTGTGPGHQIQIGAASANAPVGSTGVGIQFHLDGAISAGSKTTSTSTSRNDAIIFEQQNARAAVFSKRRRIT